MQATRTYVQMTNPAQFRPAFGDFPAFDVRAVEHASPELYRECYRAVGRDYHWRDRWDWSDAEIARHLATPGITFHVARLDGRFAGWYELRRVADDDSVEIAYFGLAPHAVGQGLGKHLLSHAVRDAWALGPARVWLHTCTLDHAAALPNYVARGFTPYRTESYQVDSGQPMFKLALPRITRRTWMLVGAGVVLVPLLVFSLWTWSALAWSYSEGERAGYVQKFSKRGWVCKTWEGELAMVNVPGALQEKFAFSVRDDLVAEHIGASMGKRVSLRYEQHKGVPTTCFGETEYYVTAVKVLE